MIDILNLEYYKKIVPTIGNVSIDAIFLFITSISLIDEYLKVILTSVLVLSAILRLYVGFVRVIREVRDKKNNKDYDKDTD